VTRESRVQASHPFYIHDRQCVFCGQDFRGFSSSKYCSDECQKMSYRARTMREWGVPDDIVEQLCSIKGDNT